MGLDKKLLMAGLAVGACALASEAYKKSKKNEQKNNANYHYSANTDQYWQHVIHPQSAAAGAAAGYGAGAYMSHSNHTPQYGQPQSYHPQAQPHGYDAVSWAALRDWKHIASILVSCVVDQCLYPWYDWARIRQIAQHIANSGALYDCCEAWELPPILGQDLVKLALFDVSFLLDDSRSMKLEGTLRRDALGAVLRRAIDAAGRFDDDGVEVTWMNAPGGARIRTPREAQAFLAGCAYDGVCTPMGEALSVKIIEPLLMNKLRSGTLFKPSLVFVITDGQPTGRTEQGNRFVKVISHARSVLESSGHYNEDGLSVGVVAVGNDSDAQAWLDRIDNDETIGGLVDVVSDLRVEAQAIRRSTGLELTPDLHALKVCLGPIDSSYDASDEPAWNAKHPSRQRKAQAKEARYARQRAALIQAAMPEIGQTVPAAPTMGGTHPGAAAPQHPGRYGGAHPSAYNQSGYGAPQYPPPHLGGYAPPHHQGGYAPPHQQGGYAPAPQGYAPPPSGGGGGYQPSSGYSYH